MTIDLMKLRAKVVRAGKGRFEKRIMFYEGKLWRGTIFMQVSVSFDGIEKQLADVMAAAFNEKVAREQTGKSKRVGTNKKA